MRNQHGDYFVYVRRWVLALLALAGCVFSVDAAAQLSRECLPEPVFDGKLCFHEENPTAQKTVLLVHGIGGSADDWALQIPLLAEHYHVLAVDLPGFGQSGDGSNDYTPKNYAAVLQFLVEQRAQTPLLLVGHSMGGAIALYYAARYPAAVERMVVADVAGILHRLAYNKYVVGEWLRERTSESWWSADRVQSLVGKFLESMETFSFDSEDLRDSPYGEGAGSERRIAAVALLDADFSPLLPRVQAPTLILWGTNDDVAPVRTAYVLQRRLPRSWFVPINGAAHVPMRDQTATFNRLLTEYFSGGLPPPATVPEVSGDSERIGRCERQSGVRFTGRYRRIELKSCSDVVISDAEVGELYAFESRLNVMHSRIGRTGGVTMDVIGSDVKMTAVVLQGDVAVRVARSRLDFAAVDMSGAEAAVEADGSSKLVCSLCRVHSPYHDGDLHGFQVITPKSPL